MVASRLPVRTSAVDFTVDAFNPTEVRRTRKRITNAQLAHLEELYRQSSHPTRDQRDALAKRLQMETKSVTIWFQNKRQTDRKVALHNATNSRNVVLPCPTSRAIPHITLMAPTTPAYTLGAPEQKITPGEITHWQPSERPARPKRTASLAPSVGSTSTTSSTASSKTRPSLDRVASRTEIRFTNRHKLTRNGSNASLSKTTGISGLPSTTSGVASPPLRATTSNVSLASPPASPPPTSLLPLWETMLSSPLTPSPPPDAQYIAYARSHKARTLDWACAAAQVTAPELASLCWPDIVRSTSLLETPFSAANAHDVSMRVREYEEATSVTEDEAEPITPHGSQDASAPGSGLYNTGTTYCKPSAGAIDVTDAMEQKGAAGTIQLDSRGWEEDEMHAALALCGLKG